MVLRVGLAMGSKAVLKDDARDLKMKTCPLLKGWGFHLNGNLMDLILTFGCQNFEEYCLGVVMYLKYL